MNSGIHDISKIKFRTKAAWFVTLLLFFMAYPQVKGLAVYMVSKCYGYFIQNNTFQS